MKITRLPALVVLIAIMGGAVSCSKKKSPDAAVNEVRKAALLGLKMNPNIEIVKTDDAGGTVTYRDKKSGEEVTLSFDDLSQGRFNMKVKDKSGRETSIDSSGSGKVTVNGPDGRMTYGGDASASAPPAWVLTYPGATPAPGSMRMEKDDMLNGSFMAETKDSAVKVKEFFDAKLKEKGFKTEAMNLNFDGKENATVRGTKDDEKRKITVTATSEEGKTTVMIIYEGPKN